MELRANLNHLEFHLNEIKKKMKLSKIWQLKGGEAPSWKYVQKIKKRPKHIFTKFQLSTAYHIRDILFQSQGYLPATLLVEI